MCECGVEMHHRHSAVHMRSGLSDTFITFLSSGSHDWGRLVSMEVIWRAHIQAISRSWLDNDSKSARLWLGFASVRAAFLGL